MLKGVRCVVEECVFHDQNHCHAEAIEIRANGNDIVGTVKGTMCATFRFRNFEDGAVHHRSDAYQV